MTAKNKPAVEPGELDMLRDFALLARDGLLKTTEMRIAYADLFAKVLRAYVASDGFKKRRVDFAKKFSLRGWKGRTGVTGLRENRDWHYHCVRCGENLHTFAGSFIASATIDRMQAHVALCLVMPEDVKVSHV